MPLVDKLMPREAPASWRHALTGKPPADLRIWGNCHEDHVLWCLHDSLKRSIARTGCRRQNKQGPARGINNAFHGPDDPGISLIGVFVRIKDLGPSVTQMTRQGR
jgi:hypothetical protein